MFDTLLRLYADRRGKSVIGEKTPAHVRHGDTLLRWYPGGRIIHMLRDPRAIYVSDLRRRRQHPGSVPYRILNKLPGGMSAVLLVQTTTAWLESVARLRDNQRRHPGRYLVMRFEDLVSQPRGRSGAGLPLRGHPVRGVDARPGGGELRPGAGEQRFRCRRRGPVAGAAFAAGLVVVPVVAWRAHSRRRVSGLISAAL